jgi:hypothetical protein
MSVTLNGSTGVTFNDGSSQTSAASPLGLKNRIINGDMRIDQRNAGASITPTATGFNLDRWSLEISQASKLSVQQNAGSVTPPAGFVNYLGITTVSAYTPSASESFNIRTFIEGYNIADLNWGTANAKTVTLSFQVYSSLTGTFGGALRNDGNNRSYPFTYSIPAANTWTTISITIAGDTTGTWNTTNQRGIAVIFGLGVGSTVSGTAGAWASTNYTSATGATSVVGTGSATFYLTGVQLEVGSTATPFERRLYNQELANCQRYYFKIKPNGSANSPYINVGGSTLNATQSVVTTPFPVLMRIIPTALEQSGTASDYSVASGGSTRACSSVVIYSDVTTPNYGVSVCTVASGQTSYQPAFLRIATDNAYLAWSAEL